MGYIAGHKYVMLVNTMTISHNHTYVHKLIKTNTLKTIFPTLNHS